MIKYILRLVARIATICLYALTVVAAHGGHVPPRIWALPSVLTLALPYFALATLLVAAAWLLGRKVIMALCGALVLLMCWRPVMSVVPLGHSSDPKPGDTTFTLLTYNILHGYDERQPDYPGVRSMEYILRADADIVCLQELESLSASETPKFTDALYDSIVRRYPYRLVGATSDLSVLSKFPVTLAKLYRFGRDEQRSFEFYRLDVGEHTLHIANVHLTPYRLTSEERGVVTDIRGVRSAQNSYDEFKGNILAKLKMSFRERADEAVTLRKVIDGIGGPLIVCGDFNDVPASWTFRTIKGDDMKDAYARTSFGPTYTYNSHLFLFHIDQILYRGPIEALSVRRGDVDSSDHFPLLATFRFTSPG